jgi:hypothetical protein
MRHDNLHYTLPNGDTFSMTAIDGRYEVAVLRTSSPDSSFVPVLEWLGSDHDNGGDVYPTSDDAKVLIEILGAAIRWAEWEKARLLALSLDQALS